MRLILEAEGEVVITSWWRGRVIFETATEINSYYKYACFMYQQPGRPYSVSPANNLYWLFSEVLW